MVSACELAAARALPQWAGVPLGYHTGVNAEQFRALVKAVIEEGHTLARAEARSVLALLLQDAGSIDGLPDALALSLAALLAAMAQRGETAEELCGFAQAMRDAATHIPLTDEERARLVDTCGTGGDGGTSGNDGNGGNGSNGLETFNISTAAGLVAAGAGASIAKHGNRAITSRCGSADVLEALGVPIHLPPQAAAECLRQTGFVFMLATNLHPAMRRVGRVRRTLPFRTIFNLLGPLANPAGASAQVVGVYAEERIPVVAEALQLLGTRHAWVVHGQIAGSAEGPAKGLDELTVTGPSVYAEVTGNRVEIKTIIPETLGLHHASLEDLRGGMNVQQNAAILEAILCGQDRGAKREIVLLNAGAALVVAGTAPSLEGGLAQAAEAVDSGAAAQVLTRLRAFQAT